MINELTLHKTSIVQLQNSDRKANKCVSRLARRKSHHMALHDGRPKFRLLTEPWRSIVIAPLQFVYNSSQK